MARPKIKRFSEKFAFLSNFLNNIQIFMNLMHMFEKLLQILGLCTIENFRSTLENSDPQPPFGGPPQPKTPACITSTVLFVNVSLICTLSKCGYFLSSRVCNQDLTQFAKSLKI